MSRLRTGALARRTRKARSGVDVMPRREATPAAGGSAGDPDLELDLSQVAEIVGEIDPHGNLIALLQRTQDGLRLPAGAGGRRDRAPQRRPAPRASTASSPSTPSSPPCPPGGTSASSATAPPATWPARRASPRRSSRSSTSPTARRAPTASSASDSVACMGACSQAPVMRIDDETYGNLTRRRDAQDRAQAARAGRRGAGRWRPMPEATVPAEGVKVEVSAGAERPAPRLASAPAPPACSPAP